MNWQERLNEHEENAPGDGWENLRDTLELDHSGLREKMLALEHNPPENVWPGIQQSLSSEMPRKALPRLIPFLRKHAASISIAASLILVIYIYRGSTGNINPDKLGLANEMEAALPSPAFKKPAPNPSVTGIEEHILEKESGPIGTIDSTRMVSRTHLTYTGHPRSSRPKTSTGTLAGDRNYIEICNQQGQCNRLTYKLEDWASCMNEACSGSPGMSAERIRQIEAWKARLEQSSFIPAAGHFFDIGEMAMMLHAAEQK